MKEFNRFGPRCLVVAITLLLCAEACAIVVKSRAYKELTSPDCVRAKEERTLPERDRVLGVVRGDEQCAYPLRVMGEHRVINDSLGGPFVILWDADSSSARAFVPVAGGRRLHFEFHGWDHGVMVLRDKETGSLWSHLTGSAFEGELKGTALEPIPVFAGHWDAWKAMYPESWVLGFDYKGLYERNFEFQMKGLSPEAVSSLGEADQRLPRDARVIGLALGDAQAAIQISDRQTLAAPVEIGGKQALLYRDGVGAVIAVIPEVDGKHIALEVDAARDSTGAFTRFALRDRDGGNTFDLTGRGVSGPMKGKQLPVVPAVETKWYAWAAYHPKTVIREVQ